MNLYIFCKLDKFLLTYMNLIYTDYINKYLLTFISSLFIEISKS